jgi:uncharacterized MAPEG superfamily protein
MPYNFIYFIVYCDTKYAKYMSLSYNQLHVIVISTHILTCTRYQAIHFHSTIFISFNLLYIIYYIKNLKTLSFPAALQ